MEVLDVVQAVTLAVDVVAKDVHMLEGLLTDLQKHAQPMQDAQGRQGSKMWTEIDLCAAFGSKYSGALAGLDDALQGSRADIRAALVALQDSAKALGNVDQGVQDRLSALVAELNVAPTTGSTRVAR